MSHNITILGDSRAFDTYYVNARYGQRYGYHETFPHQWRRLALTDPHAGYDVVHIADHFRGGTIQNNIVRLALTDPSVIVLLEGIWESLPNKGHFLDYAERRLRQFDSRGGGELDLVFSAARLVELYKANHLSVSPQAFADRMRKIVSYFRRRRREVVVMTVAVPPKAYVGSTYHAGDYTPIDGWEECLAALSEATENAVVPYGAHVVDLTRLVEDFGGAEAAFIDQWHFSPAFHAHLAQSLHDRGRGMIAGAVGADHVSHQFMLGPVSGDLPETVAVHRGGADEEIAALASMSQDQILVYADEIESLDNPRGEDRAAFEQQAVR